LKTFYGGAAVTKRTIPIELETPFLEWKKLWHDLHVKINLDDLLTAPKKPEEYSRLIVLPKEMTTGRLWNICKSLFSCWIWDRRINLDNFIHSKRTAKHGLYVVWIRGYREPDEDLKRLSADDLKERKISCVTLKERLAFGLLFFKETGEHPDDKNHMTLCADSRYVDGSVPFVYFGGNNEVAVDCVSPIARGDGLRGRRVFL
jgi:hypothetical protein